jgi:hypothetical protein
MLRPNSYTKAFKRKGLALILISLLTMTGLVNPAIAGGKIPANIPQLGLQFIEDWLVASFPDVFLAVNNPSDASTWVDCENVDDPKCTAASTVLTSKYFPICKSDTKLSCIKEVWAVNQSGKRISGQFAQYVPQQSKYDFPEIPEMNIPESKGLGAVWRIPDVKNSSGEDSYFVTMRNLAYINKPANQSLRQSKNVIGELNAMIVPVQKIGGTYRELIANGFSANHDAKAPDGTACVVVETSSCFAQRKFPIGYKFGMTIKLSEKLSGWFHGRLEQPNIITKDWLNGQDISIEATPVTVPELDFMVPNSEIPEPIRKLVFSENSFGISGTPAFGIKIVEYLSSPRAMELTEGFLPAINDKATNSNSFWSFKKLNYGSNDVVRRCSDNTGKLAGVVTTNSLTYSAGPPSFDEITGVLTYKLTSPHYLESGQVAAGSYDLALRSDVARCLYGFSDAPVQAEISITSESGEKRIATTVVREKSGWLYLSAKGFTFSSPTINVKLSQEKVVAPVASKKVTIACVKGKSTKKVTAVKPKCPAGYKKK